VSTSTSYPNGQVLVSSALTVDAVNKIMQPLTCGMIGLPLPTTGIPAGYARVRIDWPQEGQPFTATPAQDGCFLACVLQDEPYSRVRNKTITGTGAEDDPITETWTYTRAWRVAWTAYGPNAFDNMRAVHSAVVFMDYFADALSLLNLFPVSDPPEPVYAPENFNAQWWPRADFHVIMYENVTETIEDGKVTSVEIKVYDGSPDDPVADFEVTT
jgi:hypothetical protein